MQHLNWNDVIARYARNRSFVEIGGLRGTVNERVSVAHKAGATSLTMVDISPLDTTLWRKFDERCKALGVSECRQIVADAAEEKLAERIGEYEYVHCVGVIYHVPNPANFILNLKSCAKKYLSIGSMVIPERISNAFGEMITDDGTHYCVPCLSDRQKQIVKEYFSSIKVKGTGIGSATPVNWLIGNRPNYGPWWFLWTPQFITKLLQACGLEVVESGYVWKEISYGWVCRVPG